MARDALDSKVYIMVYKAHESQRASTEERNLFWNRYQNLKEACRLFWIQKGHLPDERTIISSAPGYFKRQWNNQENYVHEEGFDEAFLRFIEKNYVHSE